MLGEVEQARLAGRDEDHAAADRVEAARARAPGS